MKQQPPIYIATPGTEPLPTSFSLPIDENNRNSEAEILLVLNHRGSIVIKDVEKNKSGERELGPMTIKITFFTAKEIEKLLHDNNFPLEKEIIELLSNGYYAVKIKLHKTCYLPGIKKVYLNGKEIYTYWMGGFSSGDYGSGDIYGYTEPGSFNKFPDVVAAANNTPKHQIRN